MHQYYIYDFVEKKASSRLALRSYWNVNILQHCDVVESAPACCSKAGF